MYILGMYTYLLVAYHLRQTRSSSVSLLLVVDGCVSSPNGDGESRVVARARRREGRD